MHRTWHMFLCINHFVISLACVHTILTGEIASTLIVVIDYDCFYNAILRCQSASDFAFKIDAMVFGYNRYYNKNCTD